MPKLQLQNRDWRTYRVNGPTAVFAFPNVWDAVYKAHADVYHAIDEVQLVANELIVATKDSDAELVQLMRTLTSVNSISMSDVLILTGNGRGTGAIKVARSMYEVSVTAEYLEKNPHEADLYLDFAHVIGWRQLLLVEKSSPDKVTPEFKREAEAQYNRVKGKFEKNGRVRNSWSEKSLKKMADDIGKPDLYELVYGLSSMLHHVNVGGPIGHELNWDAEALRIGHGALLQTVTTLYNVHHTTGTGFREKSNVLIRDFEQVWKEHVAARDTPSQP
jgi:hypothetical protein